MKNSAIAYLNAGTDELQLRWNLFTNHYVEQDGRRVNFIFQSDAAALAWNTVRVGPQEAAAKVEWSTYQSVIEAAFARDAESVTITGLWRPRYDTLVKVYGETETKRLASLAGITERWSDMHVDGRGLDIGSIRFAGGSDLRVANYATMSDSNKALIDVFSFALGGSGNQVITPSMFTNTDMGKEDKLFCRLESEIPGHSGWYVNLRERPTEQAHGNHIHVATRR